MLYDLAILGGGPAGVAAGVYAARKRMKTVVITKEIGGQSIVSENIQNWIGIPSIKGEKLASTLREHLLTYAEDVLDLKERTSVTNIKEDGKNFTVETDKGNFTAKSVLITTGSKRRKLTVPGADKFENKGLTYCASCDGPIFAGMDVAVIGAGNAGFETAAQLLAYTKSVTLIHRRDTFKADEITVKKITAHPNMNVIVNSEIQEIMGDKFLSGLKYKDSKTGEIKEIKVQGIFVEIGALPATDFVRGVVQIDDFGHIITNPHTQRTSQDGIWAAGDCTNGLYHQNNIAMGDAVKALEDIYMWLHLQK